MPPAPAIPAPAVPPALGSRAAPPLPAVPALVAVALAPASFPPLAIAPLAPDEAGLVVTRFEDGSPALAQASTSRVRLRLSARVAKHGALTMHCWLLAS